MSASKRPSAGGPPLGNRKVMVYVRPEIHRAVRQVALAEDRSASDVYGEAARAFLEARGVEVAPAPEPEAGPRPSAMADLAAAIDRQGRQIEELHAAIDVVRNAPRLGGQAPAGTKAADAMKVVLGAVREAGAAGIGSRELETAWRAAGVRSGAAETAKSVLRDAGLVRCERRRWYVDGA